MRHADAPHNGGVSGWATVRLAWAVASAFAVESALLAVSAWPAVAAIRWAASAAPDDAWWRDLALAAVLAPAYTAFAVLLAVTSALTTRLLGWRTPADVSLRLADYSWPVLDWGRYLVSIHVVRLLVGTPFRATPLWSLYLRLNGARIGRGCWINSLRLMDHNLLTVGDGTVIGAQAAVSAHTVERGLLRTAPIEIGRHVTIGVASVVGIGARIDDGVQVGAHAVVPKHAQLEAGTWVGAPVRRLADQAGGAEAADGTDGEHAQRDA